MILAHQLSVVSPRLTASHHCRKKPCLNHRWCSSLPPFSGSGSSAPEAVIPFKPPPASARLLFLWIWLSLKLESPTDPTTNPRKIPKASKHPRLGRWGSPQVAEAHGDAWRWPRHSSTRDMIDYIYIYIDWLFHVFLMRSLCVPWIFLSRTSEPLT